MPVVAPKRLVIRGKIRAQMQYQLLLGDRIVRAAELNTQLGIFAPFPNPGDQVQFQNCLDQFRAALLVKA